MWAKWAIPVIVSILILGTLVLFQDAEAVVKVDFLGCGTTTNQASAGFPICDLITGIAKNDLFDAPPTGILAILEPDTNEHTAEWESAPLAASQTLLPGSVTLDLVMVNLDENAGSNDICWSKHAIFPDGSELVIVKERCFENPVPVAGFICPFGALAPNIPAPCLAAAGKVSETVPSLILAPTVIPAGSIIELNIFCPGASFLGLFFNNGLDVDGDGILDFSKLSESVDNIIGGTLVPIDTTLLLLAGAQSISMWMIPVVAAGIGVGVFVIKRRK